MKKNRDENELENNSYELIDSTMRVHDKNKYCLFIDETGTNQREAIIDTHWHEWLEISYVIDGYMTIQVNSGTYQINKGEIVMFGINTLHRIIGNVGEYRFQCLHINMGFILQNIPSLLLSNKIKIIKNNAEFLKAFGEIVEYMLSEDIISELKYKSAILSLLSMCIDKEDLGKGREKLQSDDFSRILFYVNKHYTENISLQSLAEKFNYTSQHISLLFKKQINQNFYRYLTNLRLEKSKFLLTTTKKRILDIAMECGFSGEHTFINNFKKVYHITPSQYREQNGE